MAITIVARIPPPYPNEKPEFDIEVVKGLNDEQRKELMELINTKADENVGMPMMYTVAEDLREWLLAHNEPPLVCHSTGLPLNSCYFVQDNSMHAVMMRREKERQQASEKKEHEATQHEVARQFPLRPFPHYMI